MPEELIFKIKVSPSLLRLEDENVIIYRTLFLFFEGEKRMEQMIADWSVQTVPPISPQKLRM
jgi:hypothetical protein